MELKDFVKNALLDILSSVQEAAEATKDLPENGRISPRLTVSTPGNYLQVAAEDGSGVAFLVEFDLSVSVTEGDRSKGSASASLSIMQVLRAGGSSEAETQDTLVRGQRIKFAVPIKFPQSPAKGISDDALAALGRRAGRSNSERV